MAFEMNDRDRALEKDAEHGVGVSELAVTPIQKPSTYRSVFFQSTVVGACAFLAPGLFNAMTLTGGGGAESPYLVNTANAILYASLTLFCVFGGFFTNLLGFKYALAVGASGYTVYAAGLYTNVKFGTEWLVILGAVLAGISGGIFWACEGAIMIGYPEPRKVGRYLGLWLGWRNAGSVVGSAILLGLNAKGTAAGSLSPSTFLVFVALQCLGPFVALLLSPPDKVQRPDNTPVHMANSAPLRTEAQSMWKRVLKRRDVLLLLPLMLYVTWFNSYASTFLSTHYNVRSRALAALVTSLLSIIANFVLGIFLDSRHLDIKVRARASYLIIFILNIGMWIWFVVVQNDYVKTPVKGLDWLQGTEWYRGWGVYVYAIVMYNIDANLLYWIISTMTTEGQDAVRLAGLLRGVEAAGNAGGFGMNTKSDLSVLVPLYYNFALCLVSSALAYPTVHRVGHKSLESGEVRNEAVL